MIVELIRAFFLVFAAEMGDKSQIIAMTFATQYMVSEVIMGVTIGVLFNHGIAIVLGSFISKVIPMNVIQILAGFLFVIFGINALKIDDDEDVKNNRTLGPIATVAIAFFVSELGDKTQLTAMTLAAEANYPLFILLGTTLGMMLTSGVGIFVGSRIGNKIPELFIKIVSSFVFVLFGISKLLDTVPTVYKTSQNIFLFITIIVLIEGTLITALVRNSRIKKKESSLKNAAAKLKKQTLALKETLDIICLGESKCGTCSGSGCLIGYTKYILKEAHENEIYFKDFNININKLLKKNYERKKIIDALVLIITDYKKYGWEFDDDFVVSKIKSALEIYLFGVNVRKVTSINDYIKEVKNYDKELGAVLRKRLT